MIADENIDPISLNKKITYGFTGTSINIIFILKNIFKMIPNEFNNI